MSLIETRMRPVEKGMAPAVPGVSPVLSITRHDPEFIEEVWRLFNNFPKCSPRLEKAYAATLRLKARRRNSILPVREAYTTTVDYYEAALPLFLGRVHFRAHFLPTDKLTTMAEACTRILPDELF